MNEEIMKEALKDALAHLGSAEELIAELQTKDKVMAHIEMAKAYSMIMSNCCFGVQAPASIEETKKLKTEKATDMPLNEEEVDCEPFVDHSDSSETCTDNVNETGASVTQEEQDATTEEETPLVSIIDDIWIQFNRPVIINDYDYSAWLMEYVNREGVCAQWINDYMYMFTNGNCETVESLNEDNVAIFIEYILQIIEDANK